MSRAQVHPVCVISGNERFLTRRFRDGYLEAMQEQGWMVDFADASEPGAVSVSMNGGMFMAEAKTLVLVTNPHKGNLELYSEHAKEKDFDTVLTLYYEGKPKGNTKWGKWVKAAKAHVEFNRPKDWDLPAYAVKFVQEEILEFGKRFEHPSLPGAIVEKVGTDLGVLHYELAKMAMLADGDVVSIKNVKEALAALAEASIQPVIKALSTRNKKKLAKTLDRMKTTSRSDPTMRTARILGGKAMQWFQAAALAELPAAVAAEELGLNAWHFQKNILPAALRWGQQDLVKLIKALAASERAVQDGHVSPWVGLVARLMEVC